MLVTFTNPTSDPVLVQSLYSTIEPGLSITTRRSWSELDSDRHLRQLLEAGSITLSFTMEDGDDANLGLGTALPSYTNVSRPSPGDVPVFSGIYNTDDDAPNWSDGTNWRDAAGIIT